ncbi:FAD-dependent oxidoreductase [Aestuariimicrobium sp. T2.26MG-19.2B]|uniref:FAD-dependent oxidoreductase n=1 Tax=Aestuariimicrobium sp. T2.26MG-19.2B TaxID=3040679 RepID=UPI0024776120|nr:FAD-dependent oxidoreductase [Aestuariimicrobium sp. T2.26MG-19.2B]CAI9409696.1 putative pyridine nucleotide-disulfide oxidoreductase RclA [Aestuariimicrobium sp. T2.26MG-19.2B]
MEQIKVEVLVIGWGKGGKTLAGVLGRGGRRVAVVERSQHMYGGGCINIACVPTKALVHSAENRRETDDAQRWFDRSVASRDALTAKLRARNHAMLAEVDTVTLIDGEARFVGPNQVEVTAGADRLAVRAETIIINTGSVPGRPSLPGATGPKVHDSETLQHVRPLPRRLLVVGAGYVGLEFAGMFAHFGSHVTVVARGERVLPPEEPEVATAVQAMLGESSVDFLVATEVERIDDTGDEAVVTLTTADGSRQVGVDAVLFATGRRPATDALDLAAAGIESDDRGFVVVDEHLRTSVPGVFAVGDVNGGPQFTYISLDDHRIVLDQLTGTGTRATSDRVAVPSTMFLTPPVSRVGMTLAQAKAEGRDVLVATKNIADIAAMPRPKIVGETHGLITVVVDAATDLVLGATVFSVDSQEVINLLALAMRAGVTASALRDGIWTHPSSTEALNEVLGALHPA